MVYDLSHLTQNKAQDVLGPIQDDEALLLYAFIKTTLTRNIVELGFQTGYSTKNFLAAVGPEGKVVSIDIEPVTQIATNHYPLTKDVGLVVPEDLPFDKIDFLFYDCHAFESTMAFHQTMSDSGFISERTTIVLHDTGLHHAKILGHSQLRKNGWAHQLTERQVSDALVAQGWQAVHAHAYPENFDNKTELGFRHGLTILQKRPLLEKVSPITVIARYNEDVSWADSIENKFIVQKDVHLPNEGREASSYLWYVINNYHDLFGSYVFLQGKSGDHKISVFDHVSDLEGRPDHPNLPIVEFCRRINLDIPEKLHFTAGAQFEVSADQIKTRSLDWYKNAYDICMSDEFEQAGHIMERLWKYIFDI